MSNQALEIVERSAYSDGDLYAYEDYLLELMTQHNSVESARSEGRAEGEKLGIEKGEKQKAIEMARMMKADNEPLEKIMRYSGLTKDEILILT
ncbi:MAG: hypothetical protein IKR41_10715 [Bacteroidales bacterium]|nr:hypothetical protein [Bacteroidales bacterium]